MSFADEKMEVVVSARPKRRLSRTKSYSSKRQRKAYPKMPKSVKWTTQIVRAKQSVTGGAINGILNDNISQLVGVQDFGVFFTLDQTPNAAAFGTLFDQYRIRKVVLKFLPQTQFVSTPDTLAAPAASGALVYVTDQDDATPLTSLNAYLEYDECMMHQSHDQRPIIKTIYPKLAGSAYRGAFTGYTNLPNTTWLDMANRDIQYYGCKFRVEPRATSGCTQIWRVFADFYIEFKHFR